jgi:hypothetical protein
MWGRNNAVFRWMEGLLRGAEENAANAIRNRLLTIIAAGCLYGAVMGAYGGIGPDRWRQIFYSAIKVPLLLVATFCLSAPSFFVLNTLLGLRDDFRRSLAAVAGSQAVLTVILASLAPLTILWYVSGFDYSSAILFNAFIFAVASFGGQLDLRRSYRALVARHSLHRWMQPLWLVIFAFVGIQMGWVMRPFLGDPALPTRFVRSGAMTNAYVVVARLILDKL